MGREVSDYKVPGKLLEKKSDNLYYDYKVPGKLLEKKSDNLYYVKGLFILKRSKS